MSNIYVPGRRSPKPSSFWKRKWDSVMRLVKEAAEGRPQTIVGIGEDGEHELVLVRRDHPALVGVELEDTSG